MRKASEHNIFNMDPGTTAGVDANHVITSGYVTPLMTAGATYFYDNNVAAVTGQQGYEVGGSSMMVTGSRGSGEGRRGGGFGSGRGNRAAGGAPLAAQEQDLKLNLKHQM